MSWVKIDDQMADHPKFAGLDRFAPLALALQVRAFCYASRHLTDGFLPAGIIPGLLDGFESWGIETGGVRGMFAVGSDGDEFDWPAIMVGAGLWEQREGGYLIHDYLDYNPSKAEVLAQRKAAKRRMAERREDKPKRSTEKPKKFARSSEEVNRSPSPSPSPPELLSKESPNLLAEDGLPSPERVKDAFNRLCAPALPLVRWLTAPRKQHIKARFASLDSMVKWEGLFARVARTPFLLGENDKGWKASFDWLVANDARWTRIMEGVYDGKG